MFAQLSKTAPKDVVWSVDVGTATSFGARFIDVQPTQKYTISAWLETMCCALPGGIAAKSVLPQRLV